MKAGFKHSIRTRLNMVLALTVFVSLAIAIGSFVFYNSVILRDYMSQEMESMARIIANRSAVAMRFKDKTVAIETLKALREREHVVAASIYDESGLKFVEFKNWNDAHGIPEKIEGVGLLKGIYLTNEDQMGFISEIIDDDDLLGYVYLSVTLSVVHEKMRIIYGLAGMVFVVSLGVGLLLSRNFLKRLLTPVDYLVGVAREVSDKGNYKVRAQIDTQDELSVLMQAFNQMLEKIEEDETYLRRSKEHLEREVEARTRDFRAARDRAELANKAKGEFISSMTHELRTPLNAVLGYSEILRRQGNISKSQKGQIDIIYNSGNYLLGLINDILNLSNLEMNKMDIELEPFNLYELLHHVHSLEKIKADEKELECVLEIASGVPEFVMGDSKRLRQVLINLLANAIKYTEKGSVSLYVERVRSSRLRIKVVDTGAGISEADQEHIYEAFVRVEATKRSEEGVGLGLAICKRIISLMGGKISLKSEPGKGSCFTVELDLPEVDKHSQKALVQTNLPTGYEGRERLILIIEDNLNNISMLISLVEPLGFRVHTAENFEDARSVLSLIGFKPDLIIIDYRLGEGDGMDVVNYIHEKAINAKLMGMSATVPENQRGKDFIESCDVFLPKPLNLSDFFESIERLLDLKWVGLDQISSDEPEQVLERIDKIPPEDTLAKFYDLIECGNYNKVFGLCAQLRNEDKSYSGFCDELESYAETYDDDTVNTFLKLCIEKTKGGGNES